MELLDSIYSRRTAREFTEDPVDKTVRMHRDHIDVRTAPEFRRAGPAQRRKFASGVTELAR